MTGQTFCAAKTSGSPAPAEWAMKAAQKTVFECSIQYDSKLVSALARAIEAAANAATERERERCAKIAGEYKRDASFDDSMVGAIEHNSNQQNIAAAIRKGPNHD